MRVEHAIRAIPNVMLRGRVIFMMKSKLVPISNNGYGDEWYYGDVGFPIDAAVNASRAPSLWPGPAIADANKTLCRTEVDDRDHSRSRSFQKRHSNRPGHRIRRSLLLEIPHAPSRAAHLVPLKASIRSGCRPAFRNSFCRQKLYLPLAVGYHRC